MLVKFWQTSIRFWFCLRLVLYGTFRDTIPNKPELGREPFFGNAVFLSGSSFCFDFWKLCKCKYFALLTRLPLPLLCKMLNNRPRRQKMEKATCKKCYFVSKIVLTFCEKKLFQWSRKTFEIRGWRPRIFKIFVIPWTIYSNSESSDQFLEQTAFLTYSSRFLRSNTLEQLEFKLELGFRNLQEKLEKCTYSEERDSLAVSTLGKVLAKHFINWYRFLDTALVFFC